MKAVVIHHDDQDGRMGGYIMMDYYKKSGLEAIGYEADYNNPIDLNRLHLESDDRLCIVDYSLKDDVMKSILEILDQSNVVWIDHHKSAIETYTAQAPLNGIRYIGLAGCELAYIFTQGYRIKHDDKCVNISGTTGGDAEFISIGDIEIPRSVKLIGDWDVWRKTPNSREFAFALRADWPKSVLETPEGYAYWEAIYNNTDEIVDRLLISGVAILRYVLGKGASDCKEYAFPAKLRKFTEIECIAINSVDRSSLVFESVFDQYEVGIVFNYHEEDRLHKGMTCSIYRLGKNPDKKIDVSFIAKSFGGGGHADAAGFNTSGALPFV